MAVRKLDETIKVGMTVQSAEGLPLGCVAEVWTNVGVGESRGAAGSMPQTGAEATDIHEYDFSEAMPGEGDNYFRVRRADEQELFIPFSAVEHAEGDVVLLAVGEDSVPAMQWDVKPDFVNITSEPDSQGGSHVA